MAEITKEEKLRLYNALPTGLQSLMGSEDVGAFMLYLGNKYRLAFDKVRQLSKIVGNVILGITPKDSLVQEIKQNITNDGQAADSITKEINASLFSPGTLEAAPAPSFIPSVPSSGAPGPMSQIPPRPPGMPDKYRETPISGGLTIDLKKSAISPAPAAPRPSVPPAARVPFSPAPIPPAPFAQRPIPSMPKTPLIEADPHRAPEIKMSQEMKNIEKEMKEAPKKPDRLQFIMRPPGLPPTDLPADILNLRKEK